MGGKWDLRKLKLYLMSRYGQKRVSKCFTGIQELMIESAKSVQPVIMNDKHCFELYGFDVLIDEDLRPWLLEINA